MSVVSTLHNRKTSLDTYGMLYSVDTGLFYCYRSGKYSTYQMYKTANALSKNVDHVINYVRYQQIYEKKEMKNEEQLKLTLFHTEQSFELL